MSLPVTLFLYSRSTRSTYGQTDLTTQDQIQRRGVGGKTNDWTNRIPPKLGFDLSLHCPNVSEVVTVVNIVFCIKNIQEI